MARFIIACWHGETNTVARVIDTRTDRVKGETSLHRDGPAFHQLARPPIQTFNGAGCGLELPAPVARGITAISHRQRATTFMTLLAVFKALLYRYTGQADIVVGVPIAGRERAEVEHLQGLFLNTLLLRTEVSGELRFSELLERVRETTLGGYAHQELPFERLVDELHPQRDMSRNPLFQYVFNKLTVPPADRKSLAEDTPGPLDLALTMHEPVPVRGRRGRLPRRCPACRSEEARRRRRLVMATHESLTPGARFGGGTDGPFAALNRRRPSMLGLDLVSFALQPEVHATDDATIVESLASLRWTAETARGFAGGGGFAISPVTLRARVDTDPLQATTFAAGWTLGFIAAAAAAGFMAYEPGLVASGHRGHRAREEDGRIADMAGHVAGGVDHP